MIPGHSTTTAINNNETTGTLTVTVVGFGYAVVRYIEVGGSTTACHSDVGNKTHAVLLFERRNSFHDLSRAFEKSMLDLCHELEAERPRLPQMWRWQPCRVKLKTASRPVAVLLPSFRRRRARANHNCGVLRNFYKV
jgi:hypothetical protein